ncbi:hypothetical protein [Methylophilus aquaticus]|uniref:Uncharacterized protein n=1 Tax=Methylophilus aquaticus TaxID=1971610 RepID=A0ABT9JSB0_9PROT|nr:hypothetical protein [Methylophilus aquaticus]MDP8567411.1 hypothetical protein [Methylophilus aquaticus]
MIEISTYKQAYQFHQVNSISLVILQDIAFTLMNACDPLNPQVFNNSSELTIEQLDSLATLEAADFSFNAYLGGDVYICESESELSSIKAFDPQWADEHGEWPDVTDKPIVWDVFYLLNNEWAVFAYLWNNAGGDTFYVPKTLWQQARVAEHRQLS